MHEKGTIKYAPQESLEDTGGVLSTSCHTGCFLMRLLRIGGNLNAASRQALMQKLARIDQPAARPEPVYVFLGHSLCMTLTRYL